MPKTSLPKILYRTAREYFSKPRPKFDSMREAMISAHSAWQTMLNVVKQRKNHEEIGESTMQLLTILIQMIYDLEMGIGKFDAELPADDLIRGTELALSPCCSKDSKFIGVIPVGKSAKWRMLCPCSREWLV